MSLLTLQRHCSDRVLILTLDRPPANVLDVAMIEELRAAVAEFRSTERATAIVFVGAGDHFSYGASIDEHRPGLAPRLLASFHSLVRELIASRLFLMAAVRGRCLGGGLELAALCHRLICTPEASLGCPEIQLAAFAPVASLVLPWRVSGPRATELLVTGKVVPGNEANRWGLADDLAEDPLAAALAWFDEHLASLSSAALPFAVAASRFEFERQLDRGLTDLERLYLDDLLATEDAVEGVEAFLEKRSPRWRHR